MIAILSACNFAVGLGAFSIIGLVEPIAEGFGVPVTAAGGLLTAYSVASALMAPVLVALTGHLARQRVMLAGLALFAVANLVAALAPTLGVLYGARILSALGTSLVAPVSIALAAALSPPETRGKALSFAFFGFTLAQVAGLPTSSWLAYTVGWRPVFALIGGLALPCLVLVAWRIPSDLRETPVSLRDLARVLRDPLLLGAIGFTTAFLAPIYIVFTYFAPLVRETMGFGRDEISAAFFVYGAAGVAGNLIGGWLTDRLGAARTLLLICLGQIALLPLYGALPLPVWAFGAILSASAALGWAFSAPQQLRLMRLAPGLASVIFALNGSAIYTGIALGSGIAGIALPMVGLAGLGPLAGVAALGALVCLLAGERAAGLHRPQG